MAQRPDLVGATGDPVEFAWTHDDAMLHAVSDDRQGWLALPPVGVTAHHLPCAPWPSTEPGAGSLACRYTGQPPIVTC